METEAPFAQALACSRHSFLAETVASVHVSAARYRRAENIDVLAVVVPELKFRGVQRQIM
jgi:hypothetical protein